MPTFVVTVSHHGEDDQPFAQAAPSPSELHDEEGKKVQVEREKWASDEQKTELQDASQFGGPLLLGSNEPLLRKIKERGA